MPLKTPFSTVSRFTICFGFACLLTGLSNGAVTATLDYTASTDPDGGTDSNWEDSAGGGHDFILSNVVYDDSLSGAPSGISAVYTFNGSTSIARYDTGNNIENILAGNPTNDSATFEMIFRPANVSGQSIIWEFGGSGAGISMTMNDDTLQFYDSRTSSGVFGTVVAGEFYHAVGIIDYGTDELSLYLNGVLQGAPANHDGSDDWAGNDGGTDGGLGGKTGSTVGGQNSGPIGSYGLFDGDVAAFRLYADQVANQADIDALFAATGIGAAAIPEPSSLTLILFAGLGLLRRKR